MIVRQIQQNPLRQMTSSRNDQLQKLLFVQVAPETKLLSRNEN